VVQTDRFHLFEVIFNDPGLPMIFQYAQGGLLILQLPKGVFIYNVIVSRVLEDTRRYPRLNPIKSTLPLQKLDVKRGRTSSTNQPPLRA
jgi:hypothetical protein